MKVFKIIVSCLLIAGALCLVFIGYPTPIKVTHAVPNPWEISSLNSLTNFAEKNEEIYNKRIDTLNGNKSINHWQTLQEIGFSAPWEQNSNEYYKNDNSIALGSTITVYSPDATNQGRNWEKDKGFDILIDENVIGKKWDDMTEDEQDTAQLLAVALYYYANAKHVNAPYSGYYSKAFTDNITAIGQKLHNRINLDILELRNNNEFYRQDYRLDGGVDLFKMFSSYEEEINNSLELKCAERRYCNIGMDNTLYYKSNNSRLNEGIPATNWDVKGMEPTDYTIFNPQPFSEKSEPINSKTYKDKDGGMKKYTPRGYTKCWHVVEYGMQSQNENDTVNTAEISQNKWGGLSVNMVLNTSELGYDYKMYYERTTKYSIQGIRDGADDPGADYEFINIKFDLWPNGMYRTYYQEEMWKGKAMGKIGVESYFKYNDVFFYGEEDCNITKYIESWDKAKTEHQKYNA